MSEIKLKPTGGGAGSVSLKAPAATTGNEDVPFILPVADGSAGQFIKTDGSKNLSFSGGGKLLKFAQVSTGTLLDLSSISSMTDLTDLSISFTPTSASSSLWIQAILFMRFKGSTSEYGYMAAQIVDGSTVLQEEQHHYRGYAQGGVGTGIILHTDTSTITGYVASTGSTNARTIKAQAKGTGSTELKMNGSSGHSFLSIMEIG